MSIMEYSNCGNLSVVEVKEGEENLPESYI